MQLAHLTPRWCFFVGGYLFVGNDFIPTLRIVTNAASRKRNTKLNFRPSTHYFTKPPDSHRLLSIDFLFVVDKTKTTNKRIKTPGYQTE